MHTQTRNPTLEEAHRLLDAEISFVPTGDNKVVAGWCLPRDDADKATWKPYQERLPTREEAVQWFGSRRSKHGIARVHGKVSGNLETIDFDVETERVGLDLETVVAEWESIVEDREPGLLQRLTRIRTPRPGIHFCYRCAEPVGGNQKLAEAPEFDPQMQQIIRLSNRSPKWKAFIETRGEGGYAVGPGTPASLHPKNREYEHVAGPPLHQVETITAEERMVLLNAARMLTRKPEDESEPRVPHERHRATDRPGDDFNARTTWDELLRGYGWKKVSESGGVGKWKRPGGTSQWSATTNYGGHDLLHVFSTGLPIPAERSYNRFQFVPQTAPRFGCSGCGEPRRLWGQLGGDPICPRSTFEPTPSAGLRDQGERVREQSAVHGARATASVSERERRRERERQADSTSGVSALPVFQPDPPRPLVPCTLDSSRERLSKIASQNR